jgi:regulatory protein
MPTITKIKEQRRHGRFNIMVDNEFAVAVSTKVVVDLGLRVGDEIDDDRLRKVAHEDMKGKALSLAIRLLESRQRSRNEIEVRLNQHQYPADIVNFVIAKLQEHGLLDDSRFAEAWIESRSRSQPSGTIKLKSELLQKGVDREIINGALGRLTGENQLELAVRSLHKYPAVLPKAAPERANEYNRQANFLARRGFDWSTIRDALKRRLGEAEISVGDD